MFLHRAMRYYRLWIYSCNLVLLVSVAAFVSLAAWILSDFRMALFPSVRLHQPSLLYAYLALALQGGILQAIGCVGAMRMSERMLNVYWTLMLLLLFGDVVLGVVWLFRFHYLTASLKEELRSRVQQDYGRDLEFRLLWDRLQTEEQCCGVSGPQDYESSAWLQRQRHDFPQHRQVLPRSCCRLLPGSPEPAPPNATACVEGGLDHPRLAHALGCHDAVHRWLRRSADGLAVLGFCVVAFLKLCFLGILRYEIREMIQKIRILRVMSEAPGLADPAGPGSLLPGPAMAARFRRQNTSQDKPSNGNNNEAELARRSSPV